MPRKDNALILDMLIATQKIIRFSANLARETLADEEMAISAIVREFQVLGEAARLVTEESKEKYS